MSDDAVKFDPEAAGGKQMTRRGLLAAAGAGGLATAYGAFAAKAGAVPAAWLTQSAGTVTFGSNASDPVPKAALASVFKAFTKASGTNVSVNTVDHNTFQEQ